MLDNVALEKVQLACPQTEDFGQAAFCCAFSDVRITGFALSMSNRRGEFSLGILATEAQGSEEAGHSLHSPW
jgi:hypothetical protein